MSQISFSFTKDSPVKPLYLGLDIGTNSIGWAVTDRGYNVVKVSGKALWGVHTFEAAKTAAARRAFRISRRRRKRSKYRIGLLQEYFSDEIANVDPAFFTRMRESSLHIEDTFLKQTYSLFSDPDFTDTQYHERYPTIYHLRKELMESKESHDVRLVYLACHHIFKYRGHFLWAQSQSGFSLDTQIASSMNTFESLYAELDENATTLFKPDLLSEVLKCLIDSNLTNLDKARMLREFLSSPSDSSKAWCTLLAGNQVNSHVLFPFLASEDDEASSSVENEKIKFSDASYSEEETQAKLADILQDNKDLLDAAYAVYNASVLQSLLMTKDGAMHSSLSDARIAIYNEHASDLRDLKHLVRLCDQYQNVRLYRSIFKDNKKKLDNYVAYSRNNDNRRVSSPLHSCTQEKFNAFLLSKLRPYNCPEFLSSLSDSDRVLWDKSFKRISKKQFMPKITSGKNGLIPYQLHYAELERILQNAQTYLTSLDDGKVDEILQLFSFRLPYYVGPLDTRNTEYSWLVRRSNESVRPWNLHHVIDIPETSKRFIRKMTSKCSYLVGEDVLPKDSLLYAEFMVRNALNVIQIGNEKLDNETRAYLFDVLFKEPIKSGRITKTSISRALALRGLRVDSNTISGMDDAIPHKLTALRDFNRIPDLDLRYNDIERIIEMITVFPDSKSLLTKWLNREYGAQLNEQQIRTISSLSYSGWGRLSHKFLTGIKHFCEDGQSRSIIQMLRDYPLNLMELLSDKYSFSTQIAELNRNRVPDPYLISSDDMDNLYLSPSVRKAVLRTMRICKEVFKILKGVPEKIFIEVARAKTDSGRTVSRRVQLEKLYQEISGSDNIWTEKAKNTPDHVFNSKKLYLYYLQQGKCMYSGAPIDLDQLFDRNLYDIDHIYPRSLTKDDSYNNLVLVAREYNSAKSDSYPLPNHWQNEMHGFWQFLLSKGFISNEKYNRLVRTTPLTSEDLDSFINRQLVETRQSTKAVTTLFERVLPSTRIVYVKAGLVSDFRYRDGLDTELATQFYFPKNRNLNCFHHAKDAYLNVVVGNAYDTKFSQEFWRSTIDYRGRYNLAKFFDGFITDKHGAVWIPGPEGTIRTVMKHMNRNNILVSRETCRSTGGFFLQMPLKKGFGQHPLKTSTSFTMDIDRYGGYDNVFISHFCLFSYVKAGKPQIGMESIPIYLDKYAFSRDSVIAYLSLQGFDQVQILYNALPKYGLLELNGVTYQIRAKTKNKFRSGTDIHPSYSHHFEVCYKDIDRAYAKGKEALTESETQRFNLPHIFRELCCRLQSKPFNNYRNLANLGAQLAQTESRFSNLPFRKQVEALNNIIKLLVGDGITVDLSSLGLGEQAGALDLTISNRTVKSLYVIHRSVTGFYQNKIRIV